MGTAGRSWPVKVVGGLMAQLSKLGGGSQKRRKPLHSGTFKAYRGRGPVGPANSTHTSGRSAQDLKAHLRTRQSTFRPATRSNQQSNRQHPPSNGSSSNASHTNAARYWAPGISSRPSSDESWAKSHSTSGFIAILKLISNPAGELVPLYHRFVSARQANLVGYGLAVLANLCFVLGATQKFNAISWLNASQFWAAGGFMFVAMMLTLCIARACLRIRGLWSADVFILGTAMVPLGLFAIASATIPVAVQIFPVTWQPSLAVSGALIALLWSVSQSVMTLRSGFTRIQTFSEQSSAWFAPVVLGIGFTVGVVTWQTLLSVPF